MQLVKEGASVLLHVFVSLNVDVAAGVVSFSRDKCGLGSQVARGCGIPAGRAGPRPRLPPAMVQKMTSL